MNPKFKIGDVLLFNVNENIVLYLITNIDDVYYHLILLDYEYPFINPFTIIGGYASVYINDVDQYSSWAWSREFASNGDPQTVLTKQLCRCDKFQVIEHGCICGGV